MDIGLADYFLTKGGGVPKAAVSGILNEKFVYLDLRRRTAHTNETALETPAFAALGNGEIDFYVKELASERTYAVEIKAGKTVEKQHWKFWKRKKPIMFCMQKATPAGEKPIISSRFQFMGFQSLNFKRSIHNRQLSRHDIMLYRSQILADKNKI